MKITEKIYGLRFSSNEIKKRNILWKHLNETYFQRLIDTNSSVLDFGAGYCEFINNIKCKNKTAIDINPDLKKYANRNIKVYIGNMAQLKKIRKNSIDTVFLSNVLEHLPTKDEVLKLLQCFQRVLKPKGKVIIIQPNIDLVGEKYWNHIDHRIALNGTSVKEALLATNYKISKYTRKFLPLTTKSRLPQNKLFIELYLTLPQIFRPWAGQSLIIAEKI